MLRKIKSVVRKDIYFCLLSGIILSLPFSFGKLWILAWMGFVPLFFALQNKSRLQAFCLAYLCGLVFWWLTIYWLVHVTFLGTVILILYLALYFGIFALFFSPFTLHPSPFTIFFPPALWVLLEYLRSHALTGFPWALLGYSQYLNLPLIQIADITGAWGVSFIIVMVNAAVYLGCRVKGGGWGVKQGILVAALGIGLALAYGFFKLNPPPSTIHPSPLKISVIQGNIPQELKWEVASRDFIINKYLYLSAQAAKLQPDLIIWPEASLPVVPEEESLYYATVTGNLRENKCPVLFGAVTLREGSYYNSALLLGSDAREITRYDKIHLVPFGEYIPLKKILPFLETIVPIGDISAGQEYTLFRIKSQGSGGSAQFATLICFEDVFPGLSREFVKRGAEFLVNITNDAWYKLTSAAGQHFQASVFRAVENKVVVVRAANTGISGFILPSGKILSLVHDAVGKIIFVGGIDTQTVSLGGGKETFYNRNGDFFILLLLIFVIYSIFLYLRTKKI